MEDGIEQHTSILLEMERRRIERERKKEQTKTQ
jgi:hypothetical protein